EAVDNLTQLQSRPARMEIRDAAEAVRSLIPARSETAQANPELHLLVRTPEQLDAAIALRPSSVTLDYLDLYGLKPSIESVKDAGLDVRVASPRILKPGEERIAEFLLRCDCSILVRGAGLLRRLQELGLREWPHRALFGDFSLNAANVIAASDLLSLGLERLTPTHDLNGAQVAALA